MYHLKQKISVRGIRALLPDSSPSGSNGNRRPYHGVEEPLQIRGAKYLNRSSALALSCVDILLKNTKLAPLKEFETGVCLATALGNGNKVAQMAADIRRGGIGELSPMDLPTASINVSAARIAIEHRFKGINATLTGAIAPALDALVFGCRSITAGRAARMITVGVEEAIQCCNAPGDFFFPEGAVAVVLEKNDLSPASNKTDAVIEGWASLPFIDKDHSTSRLLELASKDVDVILDCRQGGCSRLDSLFFKNHSASAPKVISMSPKVGGRSGVDGLLGICEAVTLIKAGATRCIVVSGANSCQTMAVMIARGGA